MVPGPETAERAMGKGRCTERTRVEEGGGRGISMKEKGWRGW